MANFRNAAVNLDIGGHCFTTSKATLTRDPHSVLAHIAKYDLKTSDNQSLSTFIDRDGTHFRYILNFLRDGSCVPPSDPDHLQELQKEAEYYQVEALCDLLSHSKAVRKVSSDLQLSRERQEAEYCDGLRALAGPALLQQAVRLLVEKAYDTSRFAGPIRQVYLANYYCVYSATGHDSEVSLKMVVWKFMDVISQDLEALGYSLTMSDADIAILGKSNSEENLSSALMDTLYGPALKVVTATDISQMRYDSDWAPATSSPVPSPRAEPWNS